MTTTYAQSSPIGSQEQTQTLADIARQLELISQRLALRADEEERTDLTEVSAVLGEVANNLERVQAQEEQQRRLRSEVLEVLAQRRGSALSLELETATLSLPDELAPVLKQLANEGLVEIKQIQGGEMVSLTREGWNEVRN